MHHHKFPYRPRDRYLWFSFAFQSGFLNLGAFLAAGSLASHVTGTFTFLGQHLGAQAWFQAFFMLTILIAFFSGSFVSGWLAEKHPKDHFAPYRQSFLLMAALLVVATLLGEYGLFGSFGSGKLGWSQLAMLIILAFCSGIKNATVTLYTRAVVRVTHLTGPLTDLGIGAARVLLSNDELEKNRNKIRLGTMSFFVLGAIAAVLLFPALQYKAFAVTAVFSLLIGLMIPAPKHE